MAAAFRVFASLGQCGAEPKPPFTIRRRFGLRRLLLLFHVTVPGRLQNAMQ